MMVGEGEEYKKTGAGRQGTKEMNRRDMKI